MNISVMLSNRNIILKMQVLLPGMTSVWLLIARSNANAIWWHAMFKIAYT